MIGDMVLKKNSNKIFTVELFDREMKTIINI